MREPPPSAPGLGSHAAGSGAWERVRTHLLAQFWLKAVGTTAFMALFFVGYFHLLRHPTRGALEMPLTALDRWIDFHPWALWPYVSLWLYVVIPPSLMPDARSLVRYGWWVGGLCAAGLACFYAWPTAVPQREWMASAAWPGFELLRGVDAAGNACPSLHVATAAFSALWIHRLIGALALPRALHALNWAWFALIVWSTLATKQHVWWDVVAALALALIVTPASLRHDEAARRGDIIAPQWKRAGGGR